ALQDGLFFFSSRRRHTRFSRDWSSDVCSSDLRWLRGRGWRPAYRRRGRRARGSRRSCPCSGPADHPPAPPSPPAAALAAVPLRTDRKSTRLNSSHVKISYAVFCLKKKKRKTTP